MTKTMTFNVKSEEWRVKNPLPGRDGGSIFWVLGDGGYYFMPNPNPKQKLLFILGGWDTKIPVMLQCVVVWCITGDVLMEDVWWKMLINDNDNDNYFNRTQRQRISTLTITLTLT